MNHRVLLGALLVVALTGCEREPQEGTRLGAPDSPAVTQTPGTTAQPGATTGLGTGQEIQVQMINSQGQNIGTARLAEEGQGVRIAIQVSNLPPGPHGFHIHQTGQCEPPGFQSAGGHFAPMGRQHGFENPQGPHAGDLPNLTVGQNGRADTTVVAQNVTLREGQQNSLLQAGGTALMIHATADDYRTDPSGNSGDRIACGVIGGQGQQTGATR
ncbi:MAG TPA: superoxide dismutase family protein [Longimicrobiaceae bacterium]|nr:superoxide dismutase family protein [Longimicrobiaceae bacterium]